MSLRMEQLQQALNEGKIRIMTNNFRAGIFLVIYAAILFWPWLARPFTGHHDFTGAFNSQIARNYLRYGLIKTRLGQVTNFGETTWDNFTYHTHHPAGVPLLLAGGYTILGEHEWVARTMMVVFALGSIIIFFLLTTEVFSLIYGAAATALLVSMPLFIYPSILPVYEAPALFLILLGLFSFQRWQKTENKKYWRLLILAVITGNVIAWSTYFVIPILIIGEIWQKRKKYLARLVVLLAMGGLFFGLHLIHTQILTGDYLGGGLKEVFLRRMLGNKEVDPRYIYTNEKYLSKIFTRLKNFYGWPMLVMSGIGMVIGLFKNRKLVRWLILSLIGISLSLPIFFRSYVFIHDYVLYYTAPLVALTATIGILEIVNSAKKQAVYQIIGVTALIIISLITTRTMWRDLRESINWYEASRIIGQKLQQSTKSGQSIMIINNLLREQETQLAYYADRAIIFPPESVNNWEDLGGPDILVTVVSSFQFKPEAKKLLLKNYRLETEKGVEYYSRK